ncbi:hypothetical protein [Vibrio kanaloae]|uniref:hypothetical protein n=1 Tax=Vibrio kanaloae TaxID=170673 RepID=UPI000988CD8C|nr:hypothetical protein [Vibrio kanaloae]QPK06531.1 hypothetical protein BTD91_15315 [Vibrio kanaloae]
MSRLLCFFLICFVHNAFGQPPSSYLDVDQKDSTITLKLEGNTSNVEGISLEAIFAGFAVLISVGSFFYTHSLTKKQKKESIHDLFWLREVIYPNCLKYFVAFIDEAPQLFRANGQNINDFWESYGLEETNKIRDSFIWLVSVDTQLKHDAELIMDDLDDKIADVESAEELNLILSQTAEKFISLLKNTQEAI